MTTVVRTNRLLALLILSALLGLSILLEGCNDRCTESFSYTYFEPVYTPLATIRAGVKQVSPRELQGLGKIYFKDGYLFVNQPGEGIHVIDNRNPESPVVKSFIKIPGNYDLAIRNSTLYADSYIDLVALDIADINQVKEVARIENAFISYNSMGFYATAENGVVTDWVEKQVTTEESSCDYPVMFETWGGFRRGGGIFMANGASFDSRAAIAPGNTTGVGGSMARFTISNDYLYMLDGGNIHAADISVVSAPEKKSSQYVMWDIETIFPYEDKLFIGARSGMHIYDLATPENPEKISTYSHINSCDPVVVSGDYAYVTLRSGTNCQGFSNQLEVLDISNMASPSLVKVYPMHNPHGLGVDDPVLFICDGDDGLKIYDATDKLKIDQNLIKHYKNIHAYDAIPLGGVLMLIGEDGIFQYDYSDLNNISLLSHIQVQDE